MTARPFMRCLLEEVVRPVMHDTSFAVFMGHSNDAQTMHTTRLGLSRREEFVVLPADGVCAFNINSVELNSSALFSANRLQE